VYRGLCLLVCVAEWKSVTTNPNCLHPQGKKKSSPQIRKAGGLRIHSFPFRFQVEVLISLQEGGKLLKLVTVVAVPGNLACYPFLEFWHHVSYVLGTAFNLSTNKPFLSPINSASHPAWTDRSYISFTACTFQKKKY
jgi:hypothetical protein